MRYVPVFCPHTCSGQTLETILDEARTEFDGAVKDGSYPDGFKPFHVYRERRELAATVRYTDGPEPEMKVVELEPGSPPPAYKLVWLESPGYAADEVDLPVETHSLEAILNATRAEYEASTFLKGDWLWRDSVIFDPEGRLVATVLYPHSRKETLKFVHFDQN